MNTRQSEAVTVSLFFSAHSPHAINPTTPTHRNFVLCPVSLALRPGVQLNDQHLRSPWEISYYEQSTRGIVCVSELTKPVSEETISSKTLFNFEFEVRK